MFVAACTLLRVEWMLKQSLPALCDCWMGQNFFLLSSPNICLRSALRITKKKHTANSPSELQDFYSFLKKKTRNNSTAEQLILQKFPKGRPGSPVRNRDEHICPIQRHVLPEMKWKRASSTFNRCSLFKNKKYAVCSKPRYREASAVSVNRKSANRRI